MKPAAPYTIQGGAVKAAGVGAADGGNAGDGTITAAPATGTGAKAGVYRIICTEAAANGGTFEVRDPDGILIGTAEVGVEFDTHLTFTISDGATDFEVGDLFTITVQRQLAPNSTIAAAGSAIARVGLAGLSKVRIRAKVTGGAADLDFTPYRPDGSTLATTGLPTQVALADGVEGMIEFTVVGEAVGEVKITADVAPVTVAYVDVNPQPVAA